MEEKLNNIILVPTDFSEACENATAQAVQAAVAFKYKVVLLHVVDKNTKAFLKHENLQVESIDVRLKAIVDEIKDKFGIEADFVTQEGDIFTVIPEVAADLGANLVYLGTHGKVGIQKLTGSFALKVITGSPVPVVVVQKRKFDKGYSKIVLPITSDAGPWEKTKWATFIAKEFDSSIEIYQIEGDEVDSAVQTMTKHFEEVGVKYSVNVASKVGSFSEKVISYAKSINAD